MTVALKTKRIGSKPAQRSSVPFLDLPQQASGIRREVLAAVDQIMTDATFILGPKVAEFERAFAEYTGARHCVAVNSGTSALHLALIAAGVGPGDEVITVPMTFVATCWAISYVGATPVFVDVDSQTYTMDVSQVEKRITSKTKAILPVHLYGQPADLESLKELARRHQVTLIEDCAQAHGARYHGQHVGTVGLAGCFSFYPGKNLGAFGEGGAVVTNDDRAAARMRALRDHAQEKRYHHSEVGFNYRMDGIQGAVLAIKLKYLEQWTQSRGQLALRYQESLADTGLQLPAETAGRRHVWHLFVVLHPDRDRVRSVLDAQGIQSGLHYPVPVHLQPAYRHLGYGVGDFPVAERVGRECLSLPLFPEMTERQQDCVVGAMADISGNSARALEKSSG